MSKRGRQLRRNSSISTGLPATRLPPGPMLGRRHTDATGTPQQRYDYTAFWTTDHTPPGGSAPANPFAFTATTTESAGLYPMPAITGSDGERRSTHRARALLRGTVPAATAFAPVAHARLLHPAARRPAIPSWPHVL